MGDDPKVESRLIGQIESLNKSIQDYTTSADKYFALVATLAAAALATLTRDESSRIVSVLVIAAPIAILSILIYVAQILTEKASRIGVKIALEEHLSDLNPGEVQLESKLATVVPLSRGSVYCVIALYVTTILATTAGAIATSISIAPETSLALPWVVGVAITALVATAAVAGNELTKAQDLATASTKKGLQQAASALASSTTASG